MQPLVGHAVAVAQLRALVAGVAPGVGPGARGARKVPRRAKGQRQRRVADLQPVPEEEGWFEANWAGTDLRGRPVSRGRYLVRASLGPVTGTRSIYLR